MRERFGDTFYFLALSSPADEAHAIAIAASGDRSWRLVTTSWVLTEVGDALSGPGHRERFGELLDVLAADPNAEIVAPSQELFEAGVRLYRARPDKEWSLTDCISFVVMQGRGITGSLTGDRHFEQAGFQALLK